MRLRHLHTFAFLLVVLGIAATQTRPSEPTPDIRHKQTAEIQFGDHHRCYRFTALWKVKKSADGNFWGTSPDQLEGIEIAFFHAGERTKIVLDVKDANKENIPLLRNTLKFFWAPEKRLDEKSKTWTTIQYGGGFDLSKSPRFDLAPIRAEKLAGVSTDDKNENKLYLISHQPFVIARNSWKPRYSSDSPKIEIVSPGLRNTLDLFRQMGKQGGRVQMLVEEGQPPHNFLVIYWPEIDPWRGAKLVSPGLKRTYELDVAEPMANLGSQQNIARLPQGTWNLLQKMENEGLEVLALGRYGLVTKQSKNSIAEYTVHLLKTTLLLKQGGANPHGKSVNEKVNAPIYANPHSTRGLSKSELPPIWTRELSIQSDWTESQARHLVGLSVCSRMIWKNPRPTKDDPQAAHAEHKPLPIHPELWAIPPYPLKVDER